MKRKITVKALESKCNRLTKLARYLSTNSNTLMNILDDYNDMRETLLETSEGTLIWKEYCDKHGYDYKHNGYDTIA